MSRHRTQPCMMMCGMKYRAVKAHGLLILNEIAPKSCDGNFAPDRCCLT